MSDKQTILNQLFNHQDTYFSGDQLAQQLNISRTMVWKHIQALKEDGFMIESKRNAGYRLLPGYSLNAALIQSNLTMPTQIETFTTIDSTNTYLKSFLTNHSLKSPMAVIAEQQTNGYGRFKRNYYSPAHGGLYLSLCIPLTQTLQPSLLTTSVAVGVLHILQQFFPEQNFSVKWVNDIYANGKKIVGILTEATTDLESLSPTDVVIGIGINLTTEHFPAELKDKAQAAGTKLPADINLIAAKLINEIEVIAQDYQTGKYLTEYRQKLNLMNREVALQVGKKQITGVVQDVNDNGGIVIKMEDGSCQPFYSGEVKKVGCNDRLE